MVVEWSEGTVTVFMNDANDVLITGDVKSGDYCNGASCLYDVSSNMS